MGYNGNIMGVSLGQTWSPIAIDTLRCHQILGKSSNFRRASYVSLWFLHTKNYGKSQFLMGKSLFLIPFLMGKSQCLIGKSPCFMGKSTIKRQSSIAMVGCRRIVRWVD